MKNIFKNSIKYLSLSALVLTAFTSCDDNEFEAVPVVPYSPVTVTLSASDNNVTVVETDGDADYTITASIAEPQELDYAILLEQGSGSATEGVDFDFDHTIIIYAGDTSASAEVHIYASGDIESDESFTIVANTADQNVILAPFTFTATITGDYINDVLSITLDWSGSATVDVAQGQLILSFCDMDLDLLIYDSTFADTGIYDAATGACPEHVDLSGLADGLYYLVANVYDNPFSSVGANVVMPITLSYEQEFFESGEILFSGLTTDTPTGTDLLVATVEVMNGYVYDVVAQ